MKKRYGFLLSLMLLFAAAMNVQAAETEKVVLKDYLEGLMEEVKDVGILSPETEKAFNEYIENEDVIPDHIEEKEIQELIQFIKEKLETTDIENPKEVEKVIAEGEEYFQVTLSEEEKQRILDIVDQINELGLDKEILLKQAEKMYQKYGSELVENAQKEVKKSITDSVTDYFNDMADRVKNFFTGFFAKTA